MELSEIRREAGKKGALKRFEGKTKEEISGFMSKIGKLRIQKRDAGKSKEEISEYMKMVRRGKKTLSSTHSKVE